MVVLSLLVTMILEDLDGDDGRKAMSSTLRSVVVLVIYTSLVMPFGDAHCFHSLPKVDVRLPFSSPMLMYVRDSARSRFLLGSRFLS